MQPLSQVEFDAYIATVQAYTIPDNEKALLIESARARINQQEDLTPAQPLISFMSRRGEKAAIERKKFTRDEDVVTYFMSKFVLDIPESEPCHQLFRIAARNVHSISESDLGVTKALTSYIASWSTYHPDLIAFLKLNRQFPAGQLTEFERAAIESMKGDIQQFVAKVSQGLLATEIRDARPHYVVKQPRQIPTTDEVLKAINNRGARELLVAKDSKRLKELGIQPCTESAEVKRQRE